MYIIGIVIIVKNECITKKYARPYFFIAVGTKINLGNNSARGTNSNLGANSVLGTGTYRTNTNLGTGSVHKFHSVLHREPVPNTMFISSA